MPAGLTQVLGPGLVQLGTKVGGATVVGGLAGWTTKKLVKVVALLAGIQLGLFAYLANQGVISVHWSRLASLLTGLEHSLAKVPALLVTGVAATGIGVGFSGGFVYGFHRG